MFYVIFIIKLMILYNLYIFRNPAWSVATILTGLLSFMLEKSPTLGSIETVSSSIIIIQVAIYTKYKIYCYQYSCSLICFQSDFDKRQFAIKSHEFNLKDKVYCDIFPDLAVASQQVLDERKVISNMICDTH